MNNKAFPGLKYINEQLISPVILTLAYQNFLFSSTLDYSLFIGLYIKKAKFLKELEKELFTRSLIITAVSFLAPFAKANSPNVVLNCPPCLHQFHTHWAVCKRDGDKKN